MPKGCTIPRLVNQPKKELATGNPGVTSLTVVAGSIVPHVLPVDLQALATVCWILYGLKASWLATSQGSLGS